MKRFLLLFIVAVLLGCAAVFMLGAREDSGPETVSQPAAAGVDQVAVGKYLAQAGNCMACHTARGGAEYAGGRAIRTPFGAIYAPNITQDAETGIGAWSSDDFWHAIHDGKSKDGSLLYPAFPYTSYTRVTRADSDAMYAYFKTIAAVKQQNREHDLRFPYNQRILLAGWRALYFSPGVYQPESTQKVDWNRGAYLVQGLGHCAACHTSRNALGGTDTALDLAGGLIPVMDWYAPSLTTGGEADLDKQHQQHLFDLLKTGVSARGTASGPMAEVVARSLQHLSDPDVQAMAGYLTSLPQTGTPKEAMRPNISSAEREATLKLGAEVYKTYCMDCHQAAGEGVPLAYPPLADNRGVTMHTPVNPIRMVLNGGFPPGTTGNPRPYGMPPFGAQLTDTEVAAVVSYVRTSWGNQGSVVLPQEVNRHRDVPLD